MPLHTVTQLVEISPGRCRVQQDCSGSAQCQGVLASALAAASLKHLETFALPGSNAPVHSKAAPGCSGWSRYRDALLPAFADESPVPAVKVALPAGTSPE